MTLVFRCRCCALVRIAVHPHLVVFKIHATAICRQLVYSGILTPRACPDEPGQPVVRVVVADQHEVHAALPVQHRPQGIRPDVIQPWAQLAMAHTSASIPFIPANKSKRAKANHWSTGEECTPWQESPISSASLESQEQGLCMPRCKPAAPQALHAHPSPM